MRIGAVLQEWFSGAAGGAQRASAAQAPSRSIADITGQRQMRLTQIDGTHVGNYLQRCIQSLRRLSGTRSAPTRPVNSVREVAQSDYVKSVDYLRRKVSQLDTKSWMKSQAKLYEMHDVGRTVLRLSSALKNSDGAGHYEIPEDSSKIVVANGLVEVAKSLLEPQEETQNLKEGVELLNGYVGKLLDDIAATNLSGVVAQLKKMLGVLEGEEGQSILQVRAIVQENIEVLEKQETLMREIQDGCYRVLERMRHKYDTQDDLSAWLHYILFPSQNSMSEQESALCRQESLQRLELPEYHFDLDG